MDFVDDEHVRRIEFTSEDIATFEDVLDNDTNLPDYWQKKYRKDQGKNWELFYKRNETNFFKDRSWLDREFGLAELSALAQQNGRWTLTDIGCGVGNAMFPLLKQFSNIEIHGFDVSRRAIEFVHDRFKKRLNEGAADDGAIARLGVWDLINDPSPRECYNVDGLELKSCAYERVETDAGLLLFVLSAIPLEDVPTVIERIAGLIKPGGVLMFRDYGRYDQKEIRFASRKNSRLDKHVYVRQDGTLAVYFDKNTIDDLFVKNKFEVVKSAYITRQFTNRKTKQTLNRCWIQATYRKAL